MGWRFRKSFGRGPFRVNFGKSGAGFSWGIPGFRVGRSADGRGYVSLGIPGTGVSYFRYFSRDRAAASGSGGTSTPQLPISTSTTANEYIVNSLTTGQAQSGRGLELIYENQGVLTSRKFSLHGRGRVGRPQAGGQTPDIDLSEVAEQQFVSSVHAELWEDANGEWWVHDLGSKNGTFVRPLGASALIRVNGARKLENDGEIVFGCAHFRVHIE